MALLSRFGSAVSSRVSLAGGTHSLPNVEEFYRKGCCRTSYQVDPTDIREEHCSRKPSSGRRARQEPWGLGGTAEPLRLSSVLASVLALRGLRLVSNLRKSCRKGRCRTSYKGGPQDDSRGALLAGSRLAVPPGTMRSAGAFGRAFESFEDERVVRFAVGHAEGDFAREHVAEQVAADGGSPALQQPRRLAFAARWCQRTRSRRSALVPTSVLATLRALHWFMRAMPKSWPTTCSSESMSRPAGRGGCGNSASGIATARSIRSRISCPTSAGRCGSCRGWQRVRRTSSAGVWPARGPGRHAGCDAAADRGGPPRPPAIATTRGRRPFLRGDNLCSLGRRCQASRTCSAAISSTIWLNSVKAHSSRPRQ